MKLTAQELEQMKSVDIGAVSADALADVSGMAFDRTLPREERLTRFVKRAVNPYCIHNKNDTFTVEGVNADLRHDIPTLARRSRCFPRKLENLQAVLAVFVQAYNRFGLQKELYRSRHPGAALPFSLFDFL